MYEAWDYYTNISIIVPDVAKIFCFEQFIHLLLVLNITFSNPGYIVDTSFNWQTYFKKIGVLH